MKFVNLGFVLSLCILSLTMLTFVPGIALAEPAKPIAQDAPTDFSTKYGYDFVSDDNGVLSVRFPAGSGCSQVCPIMRDIAAKHCKSHGRCWCDEKGDVTIGHISCE